MFESFTIFQSGRNNGIEVLMLPGTFRDKVTPDIDFTDEAVVMFQVQK